MPDTDFERFILYSGAAPSLEQYRDRFPRWRRDLRAQGFTRVPHPLLPRGVQDDRCSTVLCLLMMDASPRRDKAHRAAKHHLRNVTGRRPYKS